MTVWRKSDAAPEKIPPRRRDPWGGLRDRLFWRLQQLQRATNSAAPPLPIATAGFVAGSDATKCRLATALRSWA